jgi:hypothetical protein
MGYKPPEHFTKKIPTNTQTIPNNQKNTQHQKRHRQTQKRNLDRMKNNNQTTIRKNIVQRNLFRKKINTKHHIHIPKHIIHQVLLELGYTKHEVSKQKRKKPWIHYERTHYLSLVHTDYHYTSDGRYLCTILDDASRKVLAAGEFDHKTTWNALLVLKQAICECVSWNHPVLAVLTDHGWGVLC